MKQKGGLSGKHRSVRHRRRADRLFDRQLIEEYLMEDEDDRHIPIRHRSEFHPTVTRLQTVSDEQLQLPLVAVEPVAEAFTEFDAEPEQVVNDSAPGFLDGMLDQYEEDAEDVATPEPLANNHYEMFEFASRKQPGTFSIRKFLVGCMVGTGAAAVLLLMLRAVV